MKIAILQSLLYLATQQPLVCSSARVGQCVSAVGYGWQPAVLLKDRHRFEQRRQLIAAPENFNPSLQPLSPPEAPVPATSEITPPAPTASPPLPQPADGGTLPKNAAPATPSATNLPLRLSQTDRIAAQRAWKYFEHNWNPQTGLVNSVDNLPWTTLWDQGSALLGIYAARQLGLLTPNLFRQRLNTLLQTLETLSLPATGLPNKAYSTRTAEMRQLDNSPDPGGRSGWSVLDVARLLLGLHVLRSHYPEYGDRINHIVAHWQTSRLVRAGWLRGGIPADGQIREVQEGRLGYEQYAAYSLKLWHIEAKKALYHPPVTTIELDGIAFQIDQRNLNNSGASNYLTNEPYVLWGLEMGWPDAVKPQVRNLFKVQAQRFQHTGILTAVNEDSLDRPPYFLYYNVYANGQPWQAINPQGKSYPQLRFLSTKAAFSWRALIPNDSYTERLRDSVQNLNTSNRGYVSGRYEDPHLGMNASIDVNTNAVVLESLVYQARGGRPLAF